MRQECTLWYNAQILHPDRPGCRHGAMVTDDAGAITWLGSTADALRCFPEISKRYDLNGHFVMPGFIDTHLHLELLVKTRINLNVTGLNREEILEAVGALADMLPPGQWISGAQGWDNTCWADDSFPTRFELDAVAPENPVLLPRIDGHVSWFNTRAMERAGLSPDSPDPEGGSFSRDTAGHLSGLASERAAQLFRNVIPPPTPEEYAAALRQVQASLLRLGITAVGDAYTTLPLIRAMETLEASGELKLRCFGNLAVAEERGKDREAWQDILRRRRSGAFDGRLRLPGIKLFLDGSVGAHTAAFHAPYADCPTTSGELLYDRNELISHLRKAKSENLQVMVHAIGDRAAEAALDAMAEVLTEPSDMRRRWRIEHFQNTDRIQMERAGRLGVIPSLQPLQAVSDRDLLRLRLGPDRAAKAHRLKSFKQFTDHLVINSDAPVDEPNPWRIVAAAVNQTDGEALTRPEALAAYTLDAAYLLGCERDFGSLEIGQKADFIVIDRDPLDDTTTLSDIAVLQTVIGGAGVFRH